MKKELLDIQEQCICKLGKIQWAEDFILCLFIFKVVYQDHLTELLPFGWDFMEKGLWLVWGHVG